MKIRVVRLYERQNCSESQKFSWVFTVVPVTEHLKLLLICLLSDIMCPQPTPDRVERCNAHDCPAKWAVGNWSGVCIIYLVMFQFTIAIS